MEHFTTYHRLGKYFLLCNKKSRCAIFDDKLKVKKTDILIREE